VPLYLGLLLAAMVAGLGAPAAGAGLATVVVVAALVHHRRRLGRFDVDRLGRLDMRHAGPLAGLTVTRLAGERTGWIATRDAG
jgi:hypothetical protein